MIYLPIKLREGDARLNWIRKNVPVTSYRIRVMENRNFYPGVTINERDALVFMLTFGLAIKNGLVYEPKT
jgi:hypothetical protein